MLNSGTRQRVKTLPSARDLELGKEATWDSRCRWLCRVFGPGTQQSFKRCRVSTVRHSAKQPPTIAPRGSFAERRGTRQTLYRVPESWHSAKPPLPSEALPSALCRVLHSAKSLPSANWPKFGSPVVSGRWGGGRRSRHRADVDSPLAGIWSRRTLRPYF